MEYEEALSYIHSIPKFVRPLGNAALGGLLKSLGEPQKRLKFVHIAGTNGKGSAAAIISAALCRAGYKTGLFTSPFIEVFNERIQINGKNIADDELALYTGRIRAASEAGGFSVSEFAFITALAFLYFKEKGCDIVVLETGMGGRLDATNIIDCPLVSVIMSISFDHMQYLGDTIEEIAAEKCGIIKKGGIVVSYANKGASMRVIEEYAEKAGAKLIKAGSTEPADGGFIYKGKKYPLALKGAYQPDNAAAALETLWALRPLGINISDGDILRALSEVKWMARFEFVAGNVVIDGGHNIDGIRALVRSLELDGRRVIAVAAMMEDKSFAECAAELSKAVDYVIATELDMARCLKADELLKYFTASGESAPNPRAALEKAFELADENTLICVCGSLYLAGEIRKMFHAKGLPPL